MKNILAKRNYIVRLKVASLVRYILRHGRGGMTVAINRGIRRSARLQAVISDEVDLLFSSLFSCYPLRGPAQRPILHPAMCGISDGIPRRRAEHREYRWYRYCCGIHENVVAIREAQVVVTRPLRAARSGHFSYQFGPDTLEKFYPLSCPCPGRRDVTRRLPLNPRLVASKPQPPKDPRILSHPDARRPTPDAPRRRDKWRPKLNKPRNMIKQPSTI